MRQTCAGLVAGLGIGCMAAVAGCVPTSDAGAFIPAKPSPRPMSAGKALPPPQYVTDWYTPPTDWFPVKDIPAYTANTRVPDFFWLKYDGAYALALRLRPIRRARLQEMGAAGLVNTNGTDILDYRQAREGDAANRTVRVDGLKVDGSDFIALTFKAKISARNAGARFVVSAPGFGTVDSTKDVDKPVKCLDGFVAYRATFAAKPGAVLREVSVTLDPATAADFDQEAVIFDFTFRRSAPRPRFTDIPPRAWVTKADFFGDGPLTNTIPDVSAYVRDPSNKVESRTLATKGWVTRGGAQGPAANLMNADGSKAAAAAEKDNGFEVKTIEETVGGRKVPGVRITLTHGDRCYLKFPTAFDGTDYNTMTFLAKIEVPGGLDPRNLIGDDYSRVWCSDSGTVNKNFDTFGFGVQSDTDDTFDYNRYGVNQGSFAQHWDRAATAPKGWRAVAFDLENGEIAGNKGTANAKITHWCFYYDNKKLAPGQQVVVTILDPKVSRGLMYAGGDRAKYKEFLAWRQAWKPDYSDSSKFLKAPAEGRLAKPLALVRDGRAVAEFVVTPDCAGNPAYRVIVDRALYNVNTLLTNKFGAAAAMAVRDTPSGKVKTVVYVGGDAYAKVNRKQYETDRKALAGDRPGCAIRSDGKDVFIYSVRTGYYGDCRGLANGLYAWIENNTDAIVPDIDAKGKMPDAFFSPSAPLFVCEPAPGGSLDLTWGDYLNVPALTTGGAGVVPGFNDFNRASRMDVWGNWIFGGLRGRSCNHWWGYGTGADGVNGKENETWGIGEDGKRMTPGCYTGHPCLVNVLDSAKDDYVRTALAPVGMQSGDGASCYCGAAGPGRHTYDSYDAMGLWTEDTTRVCMCDKCATPIRLPDGSLISRGKARQSNQESEFLCNQFYANACAMINQVNVYANRRMQVESIAYLWMAPVPRFELTRNYRVRFCPYVRKDYFQPVYAPCNDLWWRQIRRWGQTNTHFALYEYFLFVNCRPWADVYKLDQQAELAEGLEEAILEGSNDFTKMERWVVTRLMWEPDADVMALRKYFLRRTYREAAPAMEKFWFTFYAAIYGQYTHGRVLEFENDQEMGRFAKTLGATNGGGTLLDELTRDLDAAQKAVRNPAAKKQLEEFRTAWDKYAAAARQ